MEIIIHRGINQIGGCITEIKTSKASIIIDLGQNLPDGNGFVDDSFANKEIIADLTKNVNAIFYTHYHGDHVGLFDLVPDKVNQYIGGVAKQVMLVKSETLKFAPDIKEKATREIPIINKMISFKEKDVIEVNDITVTPYFVSHSAYDAYMFVIEADGKRILHTGDFRGHGYLSKGLLPTIKKYILSKGKIDFLITEGTMLSRINEKVMTEDELKHKVIEVMKQYKNVFIMSSSTDLERLASFYSANSEMKNRPFITDNFQKKVLEIFTKTAGEKVPSLFKFNDVYNYWEGNKKLIKWMKDTGFCMMVRKSNKTTKFDDFYKNLKPLFKPEETILIYSMWSQYINPKGKHLNKAYFDFVNLFPNMIKIHTSGHASADTLVDVCNTVNPSTGIIPIHSETSGNFKKLPINEDLKERIISNSQEINNVKIKLNIDYGKTSI